MTSWGRHCCAASVLLVILGTACGGGGGVTSSRPRRAPAPARRAKPPRVAAPVIVDRGRGYAAIARSLLEYGRWLEWHHPDPSLVSRAYAAGSPLALGVTAEVAAIRRARRHVVEVDGAPFAFVVASERPGVVSFRMTERLAHRELIDADGRVLGRVGATTEHYIVSMIRFTADGPWRLNVVELAAPPIEVQL